MLDTEPVDAILTDLQMPVMSGFALLGALLERGSTLPVAVMTGTEISPELRARLQQYGIAAFFTKPINISSCIDELQRRLNPAAVGRIAGITLFGFLQLVEVEQKTAMIVVRSLQQEGRLYFHVGKLEHAQAGALKGVGAVYEIVAWSEPKLEIFYERTSRERTITEPLQHVLMEAARLLDERRRAQPARDTAGTDVGSGLPSASTEAEDGGGAVGLIGAVQSGPAETAVESDPQAALQRAMQIEGALGAALVDADSGMTLATSGGGVTLNLELAATAGCNVVRGYVRGLRSLGLKDTLEDIMITLGKQYHVIRLLGPEQDLFLYLVLDRGRANLGLARRKVADIARRMRV